MKQILEQKHKNVDPQDQPLRPSPVCRRSGVAAGKSCIDLMFKHGCELTYGLELMPNFGFVVTKYCLFSI